MKIKKHIVNGNKNFKKIKHKFEIEIKDNNPKSQSKFKISNAKSLEVKIQERKFELKKL